MDITYHRVVGGEECSVRHSLAYLWGLVAFHRRRQA